MDPHGHPVSPQAKVLRRKLTFRLLRDWLIFTAAFAICALLLNATVVPKAADAVADATSEWVYWNKADYPPAACLDLLDATILSAAGSWQNTDELEALSQAAEERGMLISQKGDSSQNADILIEQASDLGPYASLEDIPAEAPVLVSIEGAAPEWTTLNALQGQAIARANAFDAKGTWQILDAGQTIEGRDLATYLFLRGLKIPVAVTLYLLGCIIVVLHGYQRALRPFDALSGAVAGLLADRTRPVKLPPDLLITPDELNTVRLTALADERAAKAAEQRKDELVAYLAHDLKTPLTSLIGYLSLLEEAPDLPDGTRVRYVGTSLQKAERLEGLVDELFEITRYNLHAMPVERQNVDARVLCLQVADELFPAASAKDVAVEVDAPEGMSIFVDPEKLARALGNVVRNAVAFAETGTDVSLKAQKTEEHVSFTVSDHGREISPEHLERIFEKFYREDAARNAASGNSGLGLAIAKEIMEAHQGSITAASAEGVTTFTLTLPA